MRKQTHLLSIVCLLLVFALAFVGCGAPPATTSAPSNASGTYLTATPAPMLIDLQGPDDLKARFNQDAGMPRIILLVSPT